MQTRFNRLMSNPSSNCKTQWLRQTKDTNLQMQKKALLAQRGSRVFQVFISLRVPEVQHLAHQINYEVPSQLMCERQNCCLLLFFFPPPQKTSFIGLTVCVCVTPTFSLCYVIVLEIGFCYNCPNSNWDGPVNGPWGSHRNTKTAEWLRSWFKTGCCLMFPVESGFYETMLVTRDASCDSYYRFPWGKCPGRRRSEPSALKMTQQAKWIICHFLAQSSSTYPPLVQFGTRHGTLHWTHTPRNQLWPVNCLHLVRQYILREAAQPLIDYLFLFPDYLCWSASTSATDVFFNASIPPR